MEQHPSSIDRDSRDPFMWAALGPMFLTIALSALLFQVSLAVWPFVALACLGLLLTWNLRGKGMMLSILMLAALSIWKFPLIREQVWCSVFLASIVLSWIMVLLGKKEVLTQRMHALEQQKEWEEGRIVHLALQEKYDLLYAHSHEKDHGQLQEIDGLKSTLKNSLAELSKIQEAVDTSQREVQMWIERCEGLTQEISAFQRREKELEEALAEAKQIPAAPALPANPIISQESFEEIGEEVPQDLLQMQRAYHQLQKQFQEKTEVLTQSRKEVFNAEGALLLHQKEQEEQIASLCRQDLQFHQHLHLLEQECRELEQQVVSLEQIISTLSTPKKVSRPRAVKARKKDPLTEILKEAIDQKKAPQQISLLDP